MEKNNGNFSMDDVKRLAQSDAGKQLMALLQSSHSATGDAIRSSAQAGNMEQAQQALRAFLADPRAQALLRQLEEDQNG